MDVMRYTMCSGTTIYFVVYNSSIRIRVCSKHSVGIMTFTSDGITVSDDYGNKLYIQYDELSTLHKASVFFELGWVPHS